MNQKAHLDSIKPTARSRVTNARLKGRVTSRALFVDADGRTPWARRYRDLVAQLADDAGGLATLSELRLSLIRRAAALMVEAERLEGELADGKPCDVDQLARVSGHLRRIAETIGLNKVKRDNTPTIAEIAARHRNGGAT
jgi:hypothetical protein